MPSRMDLSTLFRAKFEEDMIDQHPFESRPVDLTLVSTTVPMFSLRIALLLPLLLPLPLPSLLQLPLVHRMFQLAPVEQHKSRGPF